MDDQQSAGLNLLDFPKDFPKDLPLALIWQHICQLPMRDRCALLATCKAALGTFGEIADHMERLQLSQGGEVRLSDHAPRQEGEGVRVSDLTPAWQGDHSRVPGRGHPLKVLSWFPNATIGRMELRFASAGGRPLLRSFSVPLLARWARRCGSYCRADGMQAADLSAAALGETSGGGGRAPGC